MLSAADGLRDGIAAAFARDFDRARALIEPVTHSAPDSPVAWFWLAIASESAARAAGCLERVIELDPGRAVAREALAKLLVAQALRVADEDRAGARARLARAVQVAPQLETVWTALAGLSDDPGERLEALRRAVSVAPHRADLRTQLHEAVVHQAVLCAKSAQLSEARELFREAASLKPDDPHVWQALARLAERPADAVTACRELQRLVPGHAGYRTSLKAALTAHARELAAAGRQAEAQQRWREALAIDGRDPELWLGLAAASTQALEIQKCVETAARLNPSHAGAAEWLAKLRAQIAAAPRADANRAAVRRTIMVVDDSATIRKILALTLERAGYAVVAEPDGERAVARLAQLVPDLILLDITMPKLDGYEVCKRIKKDPRTCHVPVVMLSGKDGFFDKVKGRMVGATEYLTKPFQAPAVLAVIESHCAGGPEVANA